MAIEISNANYNRFIEFASKADARTIAQTELARDGDDFSMRISAAPRKDFIGNIGRNRSTAAANDKVRALFRGTIAEIFGGESRIPESVLKAMKMADYGKGKPLTARRILAVNAAVVAEREALGFHGAAAGRVADVCLPGSGLKESRDPAEELQNRMNANCTHRLASLALDAVRPATHKDVTRDADATRKAFVADFLRGNEVVIGDVAYHVAEGATEEQREKAVKDVCDAMARFVTGDANATYATASKAARAKMDLLMKYSSQEMFGSVATGIGLSFDPKGATNRFAVTPAGRHALKFVLSRDKAGDIRFGYRGTFSGIRLNVRNERGDFDMKQDNGGTFDYALDVKIPREGLDRFGDADWDALDDQTLMDRKQIEFDAKEGWAGKSANGIPEPYRLQLEDLHASFRLRTDNLADLF